MTRDYIDKPISRYQSPSTHGYHIVWQTALTILGENHQRVWSGWPLSVNTLSVAVTRDPCCACVLLALCDRCCLVASHHSPCRHAVAATVSTATVKRQLAHSLLPTDLSPHSHLATAVVVPERSGTPFRQIVLSRSGAPVNIVGHRRNANTVAFRQIS